MRLTILATTAADGNQDIDLDALASPAIDGNEVTLVLIPTANFDGTVNVLDDKALAGTYAQVTDIDGVDVAGDTVMEMFQCKLSSKARITTASRTVGSVRVGLLG